MNGENVILQAPTGAGKTLAAIMPYIIAKEEGLNFPQKLIYSTPRRTLVNSLYEDIYKEINEGKFSTKFNITVQTGERKEDRFFNGDIIFTTFDQSLSSALSIPVSLPERLENINVGAFLSSYLVFDEFHLFDPGGAYDTTVLLLEKLQGIMPFCIMTATLSDERTAYLSEKLNARIIKADSGPLFSDIITQKGKERRIFVYDDKPINAEKVLGLHNNIKGVEGDKSKKSIVMCNWVENAQMLYEELKALVQGCDIEVILIHSRFLGEDREKKERRIKYLFSKGNKDSNAILVSTQVIEVGIDITSHVMHTEISSIDSFLQRIGRCARYGNEKGVVYVYQPLNKGKNRYLPYDERVTIKTMENLKQLNGELLTADISQQIINRVYIEETDVDKKDKERLNSKTVNFLLECWKDPNKKRFKELIRNVSACNVIITQHINENISPYNYQSISISPGTLRNKVNEIARTTDDWLIKEVIEINSGDETQYKYKRNNADEIYANSLYLLNPDYFSYDPEMGLLFNKKSDYHFQPLDYVKQIPEINYDYPEEDYLEHIKALKREIPVLRNELKYGIELIKKDLNLRDKDVDNIIEFIIWAHDLGKLQVKWQSAHKKEKFDFIAHGQRLRKPPGHAAESFCIIYNLLDEFVNNFIGKDDYIFEVIGKTIVSHHSPTLTETGPYKLMESVREYLSKGSRDFFTYKEMADFINRNIDELILEQKVNEIISDELRLYDIKYFIFYFILIRILRLADQRATQKISQGGAMSE